MKIAMPLMLAWYFQKREGIQKTWDYGVAAIILAIPVFLIARQPDLGTALLVFAAGLYVIILADLPWKWILPFDPSESGSGIKQSRPWSCSYHLGIP